jgi:hypothetical protein
VSVFTSAPKTVGELRLLVADFIGKLASGVTISSAAVTQYVYSGTTSTLTLGSPSISGAKVTVSVSGGTAGTIYQVTITATLSSGAIVPLETLLAVLPNAL